MFVQTQCQVEWFKGGGNIALPANGPAEENRFVLLFNVSVAKQFLGDLFDFRGRQ